MGNEWTRSISSSMTLGYMHWSMQLQSQSQLWPWSVGCPGNVWAFKHVKASHILPHLLVKALEDNFKMPYLEYIHGVASMIHLGVGRDTALRTGLSSGVSWIIPHSGLRCCVYVYNALLINLINLPQSERVQSAA